MARQKKQAKATEAEQSRRVMTDEHKAAIAAGRSQGATVKKYLEVLQVKGRPGRPLDPQRLRIRLEEIDGRLADAAHPLTRLELEQQRIDTEEKLTRVEESHVDNIEELEAEFVAVGQAYAQRKGIGYAAFRNVGVPASVLKRAGIRRTG